MLAVNGDLRQSNINIFSSHICVINYKPPRRMANSDGFVSKRVKNLSSPTRSSIMNGAANNGEHIRVVELRSCNRLLWGRLLALVPSIQLTTFMSSDCEVVFGPYESFYYYRCSQCRHSFACTRKSYLLSFYDVSNSIYFHRLMVTQFCFLELQLTVDPSKARELLVPYKLHQDTSTTCRSVTHTETTSH